MNLFMQKLFYPIASSLELGHRIVPTSSSFDHLAISVMEFYVEGSTARILSNLIVVVQVPAHEPFTSKGEESSMEQIFGFRFHQSYYLPMELTDEESFDITITIPILLDGGKKGSLAATVLSYHHFAMASSIITFLCLMERELSEVSSMLMFVFSAQSILRRS